MANLTLAATWETNIYQLERSDLWDAGIAGAGIANQQIKQVGNRTEYLKVEVDKLKAKIRQTFTIGSAATVGASTTTAASGVTWTTPNDGITRTYLIIATSFIDLVYNVAEQCEIRINNTTDVTTLGVAICRQDYMTVSTHVYATILPNKTITLFHVNSTSNSATFTGSKMTFIELS